MLSIKRLKYYYNLDTEKYVISVIDGCKIEEISKIQVVYTYNDKIVFKRYDWADVPIFYCDNYLFWHTFHRTYDISYEDIKILISNILKKYYNLPNFEVMVGDLNDSPWDDD